VTTPSAPIPTNPFVEFKAYAVKIQAEINAAKAQNVQPDFQNVQVNTQNVQVNSPSVQVGPATAPTVPSTIQSSSEATTPTVPSTIQSSSEATVPTVQTQAADTVGPKVSGVTLQTAGRKINGAVIHFNESLAMSSASNSANYAVNLLTPGRRMKHGLRQFKVGRSVGVSSVQYDTSAHTVTLAFGSPLRGNPMFQLKVNGGSGGINDQAGNPLNSPSKGAPGSDYVFTANQRVF
jgi:hypothetical protein